MNGVAAGHPGGATLRVAGLRKSFGGTPVLHGVDLEVPDGGVTAVLGASGCGKTTLLRLVAGFESPDAGTVTLAGRVLAGAGSTVPPHRRGIGYVAQDGALFPHLTVGGNIAYGLRGRRDAGRARVAELLEMVSLSAQMAARRPHELSGGQQQRVALARALARRPRLMLLDEPFSALDTGLRASTRTTVAATLAEAGVTTLLVTHDQEEALAMAVQVAVMRDGRFCQVGPPAEVYRRPVDRITATALGECVLLACRVDDGGTAHTLLGPVPLAPLPTVRGAATLLLRPEQIVATAVPAGDDTVAGGARGTVLTSEFLGSDVVLTIAPAGGEETLRIRQTSVDPPPVGARVRLSVRDAGVVFAP